MSIEAEAKANSLDSPRGKRKRNDDDHRGPQHSSAADHTAGPSTSSLLPSPSHLASRLRTTSPDTLKQAFSHLRQATRVDPHEEHIAPGDQRLVFARELLQHNEGIHRLFQAWTRVDDMKMLVLQPLPLFAVSNLIRLTAFHYTDHELCLSLIRPILPQSSGDSTESGNYWQLLTTYLTGSHSSSARSPHQPFKGDESLSLACLQLLTNIVRFQSGRFARTITEHFPWASRSVARLSTLRRRQGKGPKAKGESKGATFSRPDARVSFLLLLTSLLHPATLPEYQPDDGDENVDSGAATSMKLLLLGADFALPHLSTVLKSLADDHTSVAARMLQVLQRSLLRDPKLPRGSLISLVRNSDFLSLLLQTSQKSQHQLDRLSFQILRQLCGQPGRGICFHDQGWYGRPMASAAGSSDQQDSPTFSSTSEADRATEKGLASATGIFNPLLDSFIVSPHFSPLYNPDHRALLLQTLSAAKELQPTYLSSPRGAFGGGRLEPPASGPVTGGSSSIRDGARLSGLLANRLMGQLLDLELPVFRPRRPPPTTRLLAGLLPPTLIRSNLMKGLRHHDRLVRWSTLDLLQRILARLLRFMTSCSPFTQREQSWAKACKAVSKEIVKRLPDLATILNCLDCEEDKMANAEAAGLDHLMAEPILRTASLLLEVLSFDAASSLTLNYDIGKLLPLAVLGEGQDQPEKETATANVRAAIQLHTLRVLRLSRVQLLSVSDNMDTKGTSGFASLVMLSRSKRASEEIRKEAAEFLMEVVGVVQGGDEMSVSASLLFDGDQGELEAWLYALPSNSGASDSDAAIGTIALLEECITRCSRNPYRYLEGARRASQNTVSHGAENDHLSVSPLFVTLVEQMTIKFQKDLFHSKQMRLSITCYFSQLVPLLCGRDRPGASSLLAALVNQFTFDTQPHLDDGEVWLLQVAQEICHISSASSCTRQSLVPTTTTEFHSEKEQTTTSIETIFNMVQRPVSHGALTALLTSLNDKDADLKPLLLLHPIKENICACIDVLPAEGGALYLPPSVLLLHALAHRDDGAAFDRTRFLPETAAMAKLTLRLVLTTLTKEIDGVTTIAMRALAEIDLPAAELGELFFLHPDLSVAIEGGTVDLKSLVQIAVQRFDPALASQRLYLRTLIEAAVANLSNSMDVAVQLLPFMHPAQLREIWSTNVRSIKTWQTDDQIVAGSGLLRKALSLPLAELDAVHEDVIPALLDTLNLRCKGTYAQASTVALLYDLLSTGGIDGFGNLNPVLPRPLLPAFSAREVLFPNVKNEGIPGYDALQARLIYTLPGAADHFMKGLTKKDSVDSLRAMPMSLRALFDVKRLVHSPEQHLSPALISLLPQLCLNAASPIGEILADCLGILVVMGKSEEIATAFSPNLPPAEVFKLGLITFGASLAKNVDNTPDTCKLVQFLLDQGLLWLVRRFAEDDADEEELLETIEAFTALIHYASVADIARPKSHLAEPVIEAGIKRRLTERRPMELIRALLRYTHLALDSASALFATLLAHPQFSAVTKVSSTSFFDEGQSTSEPVGRLILISCSYYLASRYPIQLLTTQNVQALLSIYSGTLTLSDRLLFNLLEKVEHYRSRVALAPLIRGWSADGSAPSTSAPLALDALLSLQPHRVFLTCAGFPRSRTYGHLQVREDLQDIDSNANSARPEAETYDPLWVLSLLAASLAQDSAKIIGLQWLAILRSCSIGVAVCALSSKSASVRHMALCIMQSVYTGVELADLQEPDHVLLALDSLRSSLPASGDEDEIGRVPPVLPLTTTLFFAHHLRLLATPSSIFYPVTSRFLLQRATFDTSDVPMLYNMLQSTDAEHWRAHRLWMLRFLRDTLSAGGATLEWRVMKRRYVWDLLASIYTESKHALRRAEEEVEVFETGTAGTVAAAGPSSNSSSLATLKQTLSLIEETMLAAVSLPRVAVELLTRKAFAGWLFQQISLENLEQSCVHDGMSEASGNESLSPQRGSTWLLLLHRALQGDILERLDRSTAGTWISSTLDILEGIRNFSAEDLKRATDLSALIAKHLQTQMTSGEAGLPEDLRWTSNRLVTYVIKLASSAGSPSLEKAEVLLETCSRLETLLTSLMSADAGQLHTLRAVRGKLTGLVLGSTKLAASDTLAEQREILRREEVRKVLAPSTVA